MTLSWKALTGMDNYPMSILLVSGKFASEHSEMAISASQAYRQSVEKVNREPDVAAVEIEKLGIMDAQTALKAIPYCALVYKDGSSAEEECRIYYDILLDLDGEAVLSKAPDKGFWF